MNEVSEWRIVPAKRYVSWGTIVAGGFMTAFSRISSLKFDEASVGLGDEMRAARAHLGRSVDDVESALRIKAKYIDAIENCDRSLLPDRAYADGFIKTYARYLGLEPDETLARFDAEAAHVAATKAGASSRNAAKAAKTAAENASFDPLSGYDKRSSVGDSIGGGVRLVLSLWPLALLGAIGFGAWYGFQAARDAGMIPENISIISQADEAQPIFEANISENDLNANSDTSSLLERPSELSYANLGVVPYWHAPDIEVAPQDGPIEDISAETAGVFSPRITPPADGPNSTALRRSPAFPFDAREIAAEARAALTAEMLRGTAIDGTDLTQSEISALGEPQRQIEASDMATMGTLALVAHADTWIEIRDAAGKITYTGVLSPGESVPVTEGVDSQIKIGNAGGLFARIGNVEYGPFGNSGSVMRNIALERTALIARFGNTAVQ